MGEENISYESAIGKLLKGSQETKLERITLLIGNGMDPAEALIADEAAIRAVQEMGAVLGRTVDGLNPGFQINSLLYIMRVVVENMDKLEDVLNQMIILHGIEKGIPMVNLGDADCDCPNCSAARERRRSMN